MYGLSQPKKQQTPSVDHCRKLMHIENQARNLSPHPRTKKNVTRKTAHVLGNKTTTSSSDNCQRNHSVQMVRTDNICGQRRVRRYAGTLTSLVSTSRFFRKITFDQQNMDPLPLVGNPRTFRRENSTEFPLAADPRVREKPSKKKRSYMARTLF